MSVLARKAMADFQAAQAAVGTMDSHLATAKMILVAAHVPNLVEKITTLERDLYMARSLADDARARASALGIVDEPVDNLSKAIAIVTRIGQCVIVQKSLKDAFRNDQLEGGWQAALDHPIYLDAEAEIARLQEEFKALI